MFAQSNFFLQNKRARDPNELLFSNQQIMNSPNYSSQFVSLPGQNSLRGDVSESDDGKQENSLGQLTKNFIRYIKNNGNKNININEVVEELGVKKRRIYDITNVLQGINYIEKKGKNEICWVKSTISNKTPLNDEAAKVSKRIKQLKSDLEILERQEAELNEEIKTFKLEFEGISKKEGFNTFGYIIFEDLTELSKLLKHDLTVVQAQKGTMISIIDNNEAKSSYESKIKGEVKMNENMLNSLNKQYHIFFESAKEQLKIFNISNESYQEITNDKLLSKVSKNSKSNVHFDGKIIRPFPIIENNYNNYMMDTPSSENKGILGSFKPTDSTTSKKEVHLDTVKIQTQSNPLDSTKTGVKSGDSGNKE